MILEEIALKNWRGYRDPHTFRFDKHFNLLVGRNEAGKSTLFEALLRTLFDRFTSKAEDVQRLRPLASALAPEAQLIFSTGGRRYRISKRFLDKPSCELAVHRNNGWERTHEGDAADLELRSLLSTSVEGRKTTPEQRGLMQALWYLQRDPAVPERAWSSAIRDGLASLLQVAVHSPEEDRIVRKIGEEYRRWFTETGKITSISELAKVNTEVERLDRELAALRQQAADLEGRRSLLEEKILARDDIDRGLAQSRTDIGQLDQQLRDAEAFEERVRVAERAKDETEREAKRIGRDLGQVRDRIEDIKSHTVDLDASSRAHEQLAADARIAQALVERHHRARTDLDSQRRRVAGDVQTLQSLERLRKLRKDQKRLKTHLEKRAKVTERIEELGRKLAGINAPTKAELTTIQEQGTELRKLTAKIEVAAIRIAFELETKARIRTEPEAKTADGEYIVTAPTSFSIAGIGQIRVRGVGQSLDKLNAQADDLRASIELSMARFGAKDEETIIGLRQRQMDLQKELKDAKARLEEVDGEEKDAAAELAKVDRGIQQEAARAKEAPDEWRALGGEALRERIEEWQAKIVELEKKVGEEDDEERKANKQILLAAEQDIEAMRRTTELATEIRSLKQSNEELLESFGTIERLEAESGKAEETARRVSEAFDHLMSELDARVTQPRRLHKLAVDASKILATRIAALREEIAGIAARIEDAAAQNLYSRGADAEAELSALRRRQTSLSTRAEAARLLYEMVQVFRKEQSAALAAPVTKIVGPWLKLLSEERYDGLELDGELLPAGVNCASYGEKLPLDSLSHGTHEQVVVLLRLALGVLLSSQERHLVVIDDRLVNADPIRLKRICLILEEVASKHCQIILATCNETPYAGLQGRVIHVPEDGRLSEP